MINYCNEKLQQLFVELTIGSEQKEYIIEVLRRIWLSSLVANGNMFSLGNWVGDSWFLWQFSYLWNYWRCMSATKVIYPSFCLFIHLSIHPSSHLSINSFISSSIYPSSQSLIYLSIHICYKESITYLSKYCRSLE